MVNLTASSFKLTYLQLDRKALNVVCVAAKSQRQKKSRGSLWDREGATSCQVEKHKGRLKREGGIRTGSRRQDAFRTTANKLKMEDQQWGGGWIGDGLLKQGQRGWLTPWWLVLLPLDAWPLFITPSLRHSQDGKKNTMVMNKILIILLLGSDRHLQRLELWDWRYKLAGRLLLARVGLQKYSFSPQTLQPTGLRNIQLL